MFTRYTSKKQNVKIERKRRLTKLFTGYDEKGLQQQLAQKVTMETFFEEVPNFNENVQLIKGVICGYRVEEIEDPLMQKIRYLDKLIDELAKGKAMEKILRT